MSVLLLVIGDTPLYSSPVYESDSELWPYDAMLLDDWVEVESFFHNESALVIDHRTDGKSSASFVVYDAAGAYTFYERQQVLIQYYDGEREFGGVIQSCEAVSVPGTAIKFHSIEAVDYTALLSWRIVDYAAENKAAGDAVREILTEYLAEEDITTGYIADGVTLSEISLPNKTAYDALAALAEACNFVFYLDYDLKLYFHARSLYSAAWDVADGSDILVGSLGISRENAEYRNTEIIIGGYEKTALQTESWIGDGTTKTFPLAYPASEVTSVTVDSVAKTIGSKGADSGSYDSYYAVVSETLSFEAAPANGKVIVAQYYGLWRPKAVSEDLSAIAANAARMGVGSGKIEHVFDAEGFNSIAAAGEFANAKISEYGIDGVAIQYTTTKEGLAAGVLQHFEYQGIDEDILIYQVQATYKDGNIRYTISAAYGPIVDDWVNFFVAAMLGPGKISAGAGSSSSVTKSYNFSHTFYNADRPNPFLRQEVGAGAAIYETAWPCFDPNYRAEYIELWYNHVCQFRKAHTSVPDETEEDEFHSYSFISPAEAVGEIDEVVFYGGDSATATNYTGVELFRAAFVHTKTVLESLQINATYINGDYA